MTDIPIRSGVGNLVDIPPPNENGQALAADSSPTVPASDWTTAFIAALLAGTQKVSAASLPLPSGAATDANLSSIATAIEALEASGNTLLAAIVTALAGTLKTVGPLPAVIIAAQQAATGSVLPLPSLALQNGVILKALPANTGTINILPAGGSGNGYPLNAGEAISYAVANLNQISISGNGTDLIAFTGN